AFVCCAKLPSCTTHPPGPPSPLAGPEVAGVVTRFAGGGAEGSGGGAPWGAAAGRVSRGAASTGGADAGAASRGTGGTGAALAAGSQLVYPQPFERRPHGVD